MIVTTAIHSSSDTSKGVQRFHSYLQSFSQSADISRIGWYPDLSSQAFHDPIRFPIAQALEERYEVIRRELLALGGSVFHREMEKVERTGSWEVVHLFERGCKNVENCRLCPSTVHLIESYSTVRTVAGLTYVSKMAPGTHVAAHCGPTNVRMRCHLGVQVPEGDCAIRVGEEVRSWQEGQCIIFDDSLEHESWNHTAKTRIVLIVDLWHPDLTAEEIALLEGLHNYSSAQADNLMRYWMANANARNARRVGYD
jgi:aspartyl/asparaginyl beta-hydroxylase (cupin superfamily)